MIALLCPTRGRPEQCKRMIDSIVNTVGKYTKIDVCLGFSEEDENSYNIPVGPYNKSSVFIFHYNFNDEPTAHKWNVMAVHRMSFPGEHKLFMLAADDMIFSTPCWDKALLDHYNNLEDKIHVYALRDSRDPLGTPHPIVTREYINAMGYFLPPIFLHWFVDSWTVEIAKANNCFTHLNDYMLIHDKPSDKGEGDETHNHIRSMGWRERDGWVNKHCQHYLALEKNRLKSKISKLFGMDEEYQC